MADPFVAEIYIMANNFAPRGFAFCNGQLMAISQNTALFALLGTFYGGDGKSTFALPNLQGSAPLHQGQGQGLTERFLGEQSGTSTVTLLQSEMPAHAHAPVSCRAAAGLPPQAEPTGRFWAGSPEIPYALSTATKQNMAPTALAISGGSLPHNNLMPYLTLNFVIAMQGVFPPRG